MTTINAIRLTGGIDARLTPIVVTTIDDGAPLRIVASDKAREAAAREVAVRTRSAIYQWTDGAGLRVETIDGRRFGAADDLAVALGCLVARGIVPGAAIEGGAFVGELSLAGELRPVRGAVLMLRAAQAEGAAYVIAPEGNREDAVAAIRAGVTIPIYLATCLPGVVEHLWRSVSVRPSELGRDLKRVVPAAPPREPDRDDLSWAEAERIPGADRVAEAVRAGAKVILLVGQPGAGKTTIARRVGCLLPDPTDDERTEIATISSAAGLGIAKGRPFRAPHHTVSAGALVGGGDPVRPGEVSLAHRGVLLLDEINEYRRDALDSIADALKRGTARVARREGGETVTYVLPAEPAIVIAACNPCPCGYRHNPKGICGCTAERLAQWDARVSGIADKLGAVRVEIGTLPRPTGHGTGAAIAK